MCSSISKVNAQTLEAFRDIRNELIDRITTHDEVSINKIKKLEEMGKKLEKKNQELFKTQDKRMEEEEKKLEIKRQ
jgi:lysozyme family protein